VPDASTNTLLSFGNAAGDQDRLFIRDTAVMGSNLPLGTLNAARFVARNDNLAQQANDQFIFRLTDRTLWYDENGNAGGGRHLLFDLQANATLTASDIVIFSDL